MCRSIKVLRRPEEPATSEEMSAAALQFVRKVSGSRKPSKVNQAAFDKAVAEIASSVEKLLGSMTVPKPRPVASEESLLEQKTAGEQSVNS